MPLLDDTSWEAVADFGIDKGELDCVPSKLAFVLGVEWAQVRTTLMGLVDRRKGDSHLQPIHKQNEIRIKRLAWSMGWMVVVLEEAKSPGENWMMVEFTKGRRAA